MARGSFIFGKSREQLAQSGALAGLLLMAGLALAGPSGLLAWSENVGQLERYEVQIAKLQSERNDLANLVERLDPDGADPDLVGELLRRNLNVAHPDEIVVPVKPATK